MQIEYKLSKKLAFFGQAIGNVEIESGINNLDVNIVKYLINTDYFKLLVENETILLLEALPEESEVTEDPKTVVAPKKRKPTIEFIEEAE